MKSKVFLDTNIVTDLIDATRTNHQNSLSLIEKLIFEDSTICISEDMISTLYYISKDKKATLEFLDNVVLEDWEVLSFTTIVIKKATQMCLANSKLDLEDVMQCICASEHGCGVIYTYDKSFVDCGTGVVISIL